MESKPRKSRFFRDSLIIVGNTVLLLLLMEFAVRLFWPQTESHVYVTGESLGIKDEVLGHLLRPNAHSLVTLPEFSVEYITNGAGMRDEAHHPIPKPSDMTRILVLGDSFTFGEGNDYADIWPVILERDLLAAGLRVDVVKAGVEGFDTRQEVLYLERLFDQYEPDIVLLTFLPNDLFSNAPIDPEGPNRPDRDKAVVKRGEKSSTLQSVIAIKRALISSDYLYGKTYSMTARKDYFTRPPSAALARQVGITKRLLARANGFCEVKGCEFMVLSIPQQFQVIVKAGDYSFENTAPDVIDDVFSEFAEDKGFPWIPTLDVLVERYESAGRDLYYRLDGHLTKEGNQVVGDRLVETFHELLKERAESGGFSSAAENAGDRVVPAENQ